MPIQIAVTNGTFTLSQTTGLTFQTGTGSGDATMTFTGTLANINAALNGATFTPTAGYFGAATVQFTSADEGQPSPPAGPDSSTGTVGITVSQVDHAPVNTVPG